MRRYLVVVLIFCAITNGLFAFGSREMGEKGAEDAVRTEEQRRISLILVSANPSDQTLFRSFLAEEASLFLFQEFSTSGKAVKISSNRRFSMPVEERKKIDIPGVPLAMEYQIELSPAAPVSYHLVQANKVVFSAEKLIAPGRVRLQPGRKALLTAATDSGISSGLIRIKSLTSDRKGNIAAVVEIARAAK
ncbi:hypothetical protein [Marispirochaeta sp.]|uniref:hypothetical protein n=1 Tax=Marispirochaeta sp. TaxID=2038653 RepID=UPI0029C7B2FB|nr:hypothetical protein [Marispirochaeta sp.]